MVLVMNDYTLDSEITTSLATAIGKLVGLNIVPGGLDVERPYAVLRPATSPSPLGDLGSRTSNRTVRYSIFCVGEDERQVRWMQGKVFDHMMSNPFTDTQWVECEGLGAIVPDGDVLYSSTDVYKVRI